MTARKKTDTIPELTELSKKVGKQVLNRVGQVI